MRRGGRDSSRGFREVAQQQEEYESIVSEAGLLESKLNGVVKMLLSCSDQLFDFLQLDHSESMLSVLALEFIRGAAIASALNSGRANETSKARTQGLKSLFLSAIVDEPAVIPARLTPPQVHGACERYGVVLRYTGQEEYVEIVRRKGAFGYLLDRVDEVDSKEVFGVIYFPSCLKLGNMVIWGKLTSADSYSISTCTIDNQHDPERDSWAVCTYKSQDAFDRAVQRFIDEGAEAAERDHRDSSARIAFFCSKYHEYCHEVGEAETLRRYGEYGKYLPRLLNVRVDLHDLLPREAPPSSVPRAPARSGSVSPSPSSFLSSPSVSLGVGEQEGMRAHSGYEEEREIDRMQREGVRSLDLKVEETNARMERLELSLRGSLDTLAKNVHTLEREKEALNEAKSEVEAGKSQLGELVETCKHLQTRVDDLQAHVQKLEQKLGEVQKDRPGTTTRGRLGDDELIGRGGSGAFRGSSSRREDGEIEGDYIREREGGDNSMHRRPVSEDVDGQEKVLQLPSVQRPQTLRTILNWVLICLLVMVVSAIGLLPILWAMSKLTSEAAPMPSSSFSSPPPPPPGVEEM
eukprot:CAMPEP_0113902990 /NCGR_PEP_ID=MMETSP0780_2-20120614/22204_1 /TAXON_ID=652834 /ORGANISM="Palpitomonas bilix" /LENGTH=576 /DNA_ID=CAMNT_0000895951 /DNA_START=116 /DNA_END=1846 /DNA_ORIENTATION=- /assembly_acc=CAM_ASM_000599